MSITMIEENKLEELVEKLVKGVKSEKDFEGPLGQLMKMTLQKVLDAEMD